MLRKVLTLVYKSKHKGSLTDLPKLIEVVMSCNNPEHCDTAKRYVELYVNKHIDGKAEDGYTRIGMKVTEQMLRFIADTKEHAQLGMHYPKHNDGAPISSWPNMNNYVGTVLDVKFKAFWKKGSSSVIGLK